LRRHHRRVGGRVGEALAAERRFLRPLPDPFADVDARTEVRVQNDGFVRVRSVNYSVPPGRAGRRVQVRLSQRQVVLPWRERRSLGTFGASPRPTSSSIPARQGARLPGRPDPVWVLGMWSSSPSISAATTAWQAFPEAEAPGPEAYTGREGGSRSLSEAVCRRGMA
jgi:hypothetical protein